MLRQGSDSIFKESAYFLLKQSLLCLIAIKFCRVVKTISTQLLVKKNWQILLKSTISVDIREHQWRGESEAAGEAVRLIAPPPPPPSHFFASWSGTPVMS